MHTTAWLAISLYYLGVARHAAVKVAEVAKEECFLEQIAEMVSTLLDGSLASDESLRKVEYIFEVL